MLQPFELTFYFIIKTNVETEFRFPSQTFLTIQLNFDFLKLNSVSALFDTIQKTVHCNSFQLSILIDLSQWHSPIFGGSEQAASFPDRLVDLRPARGALSGQTHLRQQETAQDSCSCIQKCARRGQRESLCLVPSPSCRQTALLLIQSSQAYLRQSYWYVDFLWKLYVFTENECFPDKKCNLLELS